MDVGSGCRVAWAEAYNQDYDAVHSDLAALNYSYHSDFLSVALVFYKRMQRIIECKVAKARRSRHRLQLGTLRNLEPYSSSPAQQAPDEGHKDIPSYAKPARSTIATKGHLTVEATPPPDISLGLEHSFLVSSSTTKLDGFLFRCLLISQLYLRQKIPIVQVIAFAALRKK